MIQKFPTGPFVAGFMLGAIFAAAWFLGSDFTPLSFPSPAATTTATTVSSPESGAISIVDQSAGPSVSIESVTVPPPGVWVAVREVNGNDLGNVLGAVRVTGPRSMVSVPLLRATESGLPYAVELYRADGGETFDLATDSVYIDFATGEPVIAHFTTNN